MATTTSTVTGRQQTLCPQQQPKPSSQPPTSSTTSSSATAAAHFTSAFRLAPQLATAFADELAGGGRSPRTGRKQGSEEAWRAVAGAYLTCINACPANALLLTRLGVRTRAASSWS